MPTIDLNTLTAAQGFRMNGTAPMGTAGASVAMAGDVNGDGLDDLVVGGPLAVSSYVIFGRAGGLPVSIALDALTPDLGYRLDGLNAGGTGFAVAGLGDINGDGLDDIATTSVDANRQAGVTHVVYGAALPPAGSLNLAALPGSQGFGIGGGSPGTLSGFAVAGIDFNGDGRNEIALAELGAAALSGQVRIAGSVFRGGAAGDEAGRDVANAGDVNGDGIDDLLIGAADRAGKAGAAYLIYGAPTRPPGTYDLDTLATAAGVRFDGAGGSMAGYSLAGLGDVNGDGLGDFVVGAPGTSGAGKAYVVYGRAGGFGAGPVALADLSTGQGTVLLGSGSGQLGWDVAAAGDMNGDGLDDIVVAGLGAPNAYILYGRQGGFGTSIQLSTLAEEDGIVVTIGAAAPNGGWSAAGAGDLNGDGLSDALFGMRGANGGGGSAFVVYGAAVPVIWTGGAGSESKLGAGKDDVLRGGGGADTLRGALGDDVLGGGSEADSLEGGAGQDTLDGGESDDSLDGGQGADLLSGGAGNDRLDGGAGADTMVGGAGLDTYVVDDAGDILAEDVLGLALVLSAVTWTLAPNFADLTLTGGAAIDGTGNDRQNLLTGNDAANRLSGGGDGDALLGRGGDDSLAGDAGADLLDGNDGNDSLDGGAGADTMIGGAGNDTYVVDDAGDVLREDAAGLATVLSSVTWTLAANFFDLTLIGTAGLDGTGNARDNWITGNGSANGLSGGGGNDLLEGGDGKDKLAGGNGDDLLLGGAGKDNLSGGSGNDILDGGGDADKLAGGSGADRFVFAVAPAVKQADTITDFSAAQGDRVEILRTAFDPGGTSGLALGQLSLQAGRFEANLAGQATAAGTRFVYDTDAGSLHWDADGSGAGAAVEVARFTGLPALAASDIWLV